MQPTIQYIKHIEVEQQLSRRTHITWISNYAEKSIEACHIQHVEKVDQLIKTAHRITVDDISATAELNHGTVPQKCARNDPPVTYTLKKCSLLKIEINSS